ncbi:MAG: hypothetical protein R3C28_04415 [Pirellulaceae bacterium]
MLADLTDDCVGSFSDDRAKSAANATVICNRRCIVVLWWLAFNDLLTDTRNAGGVMLYSDLLKRYERKRLRNASLKSIALHQVAFNHFERFLKRPPTTDDGLDEVVEDFIFGVVSESVKLATINRDLYCILALWRFANRHRNC